MRKISIILIVNLLFTTATFAQVKTTKTTKTTQPSPAVKEVLDRSKKPEPGPAPVIKIGEAQSFELANGLKVFVVENHKVPRITYSLVLDYDPIYEGDFAGYVDIAGQLLRTGTATRTKDEIDEAVDFIGANLNTQPTGLNASCLTRHNEKLLELIADILLNASFRQDELEKVRTQTISGLEAAKNESGSIARNVSSKLVYTGLHPYGEITTIESVKKVTLDKCTSFYQTYFKPNIGYLAIVGDITLPEARTLVEKYLGRWEKAEVPPARYMVPKAPAKTTVAIVDRPNAVQSTINVCYPVDLKPGSADDIKARVTNAVLGGGTFRLYNNLREKHGWTYGAYSSLTTDKLTGKFIASAEVRNPVSDSAVQEILNEMTRMRAERVPEDELQMVKNFMSGNFGRSLENPQTVANFAINTARYKLPADYYANYLANLNAVSPDDVQMMAQKYIRPDNSYILLVGKAEEIAPKLKPFAKGGEIQFYDFEGVSYDPSKKLLPAPAGVTAETVVKKYIETLGGEKALKKVKNATILASTAQQGMTINFDSYYKVPDKFMMQIGSSGMIFAKQIYSDGKGLSISPMANEKKPIEGDDLLELKAQATLFTELNYSALGFTTVLLGIEEMKNGDKLYKVQVTKPGGGKDIDFYDVNTGLKVKTESSKSLVEYGDYRDVKGIKFPFLITQSVEGQSFKLTVSSVTLNSKLSDDMFKVE